MTHPTDNDIRKYSKLVAIGQIGMEMAVPVGVGIGVDFWLNTLPWFTILGAILGPILGFMHLMALLRSPAPTDKK